MQPHRCQGRGRPSHRTLVSLVRPKQHGNGREPSRFSIFSLVKTPYKLNPCQQPIPAACGEPKHRCATLVSEPTETSEISEDTTMQTPSRSRRRTCLDRSWLTRRCAEICLVLNSMIGIGGCGRDGLDNIVRTATSKVDRISCEATPNRRQIPAMPPCRTISPSVESRSRCSENHAQSRFFVWDQAAASWRASSIKEITSTPSPRGYPSVPA